MKRRRTIVFVVASAMILLGIFIFITVDNIAVRLIALIIIFGLGVGIVRAEILGPTKDDRELEEEFGGVFWPRG